MDIIGKLYVLSGIVNTIGLLTCNKFYTNASALAVALPTIFSIESQLLINTWGLAYLAASTNWKKNPALSSVFCIEKMLYFAWWISFMVDQPSRKMAIDMLTGGEDVLLGSFLLAFGLNDLFFGVVFGIAALIGFQEQKKTPPKSD